MLLSPWLALGLAGILVLGAAGCSYAHPDVALRRETAVRIRTIGYALHMPDRGRVVRVTVRSDPGCLAWTGAACCLATVLNWGCCLAIMSRVTEPGMVEMTREVIGDINACGWVVGDELRAALADAIYDTDSTYRWVNTDGAVPLRALVAVASADVKPVGDAAASDFSRSGVPGSVDAVLVVILESQSVSRRYFGSLRARVVLRGVLVDAADIGRPLWQRTVAGSVPVQPATGSSRAARAALFRAGLEQAVREAAAKLAESLIPMSGPPRR